MDVLLDGAGYSSFIPAPSCCVMETNYNKWIILALTWIVTLLIFTCFIQTAKDIPPAANTIISVVVGGLVGVLTGKVIKNDTKNSKKD